MPSAEKKIQHPIFAECMQYTLDPYWRQLFDDCSKGKFPRGCGIDAEGKIIYFRNRTSNNNNNYISYKLKKNPEDTFKDIKNLFQQELNYKSKKDRQDIRDNLNDICKELQESFTGDWQSIKRKKIRDPIIRKYILELKEKYNLSDKSTTNVAQMIKIGFLFNWIPNDQVVYEDQEIVDIKTLHYDEEEGVFTLDEPKTIHKREYKPKLIKLSKCWEKHLEKN